MMMERLSLNEFGYNDKAVLRGELNRRGYDINKMYMEEVTINSNRDPRLKSGVLIAEFQYGNKAVFINGETVVDAWVPGVGDTAKRLSWKTILAINPKLSYTEQDHKTSDELKAKKLQRALSKDGMVIRYTDKRYRHVRSSSLDKSGYKLNTKKYADKAASNKVDKVPQILSDLKDTYMNLASNLDKVDWEARPYYSYESIVRGLIESYRDLSKSYAKYQEQDNNNMKEWYKNDVVSEIKSALGYLKNAKRFETL